MADPKKKEKIKKNIIEILGFLYNAYTIPLSTNSENGKQKNQWSLCRFNLWPVKFLKWNNPSSIFGTVHFHFRDIKIRTWSWVSQQYRAWSDCMNVQACLALYWWQRLISLGSSRIRFNIIFSPEWKTCIIEITMKTET